MKEFKSQLPGFLLGIALSLFIGTLVNTYKRYMESEAFEEISKAVELENIKNDIQSLKKSVNVLQSFSIKMHAQQQILSNDFYFNNKGWHIKKNEQERP